MAVTANEGHLKSFVLHGSTGGLAAFRKAVKKRMAELKLSADDFEPFADDVKGNVGADTNSRDFMNWAAAVELPPAPKPRETGRETAIREGHRENALLLGRIAATLDRRYGAVTG